MYAIIGAGIGGLTTALVFEKLGITYQLFEKTKEPSAIGAGIWLAPNALKVFEYIGLLDDIFSSGNTIDRITLADNTFRPLTDSNQQPAKEKYGFTTIAIHRAKLQKALIRHIPKEKLHWNKNIELATQNGDHLKLKFEDGLEIKTKYLIGADGIDSKVRSFIFPEAKIRYSGQTCWRGVMESSLPQQFRNRGAELWGKGIRFGFSQISENETSWFAVKKEDAFGIDDRTLLKAELLKQYTDFHDLVKELITKTPLENILRNDIIDLKPMKKWYSDSICLIGDAAHATTPNMGQGGAQAIEDAYYLGRLITKFPSETVFQRFQNKRYARVIDIVKKSWMTGQIAHYNTLSGLRNAFFRSIPKSFLNKTMHAVYELKD